MFSSSVACQSARLRRALAIGAALAVLGAPCVGAAQHLDLADALSRTAANVPSLAAGAARLEAADAAIAQADVRPRDIIGVDIEDFARTGGYSPGEQTQTTGWYERIWERGGKREARIAAAQSGVGLVSAGNRLRMLDLLAKAQIAWVDAAAAEAAIAIAEQRLTSARALEGQTSQRVARALDPLFAGQRARTAVAMARMAVDQAREAARIARASLATYWGGGGDYTLDIAPFLALDVAAPARAPAPEAMPDLVMLSTERDAALARVRLTETDNVADPTGRVGLRHYGKGSVVGLVVGGSIPLGSRAANRGNLARANAEVRAIEAEIAVAREHIRRERDQLDAERAAIATEVARIDDEVLPGAEHAVALVRNGFARGGTAFTYLEVSQSDQAVIEARSRRVELLRRFHLAGARLDRLTGRHAPLVAHMENRR